MNFRLVIVSALSQVNPEAAQFQYKELPCPDILEIVFAGTMDSEDMEPSNSRRQSNSSDTSLLHSEEQELVTVEGGDEHLSNAIPLRSYEMGQSKHRRTTASEQSISSSSQPKTKAIWMPATHEVFLDLCLEEALKGNKPGTHFTKDGWRTIVESFQQKTGLMYNRLQLKNHWDITKEQWKVWCKLIGTSSMGWNPNSRRFSANDEDWANYLEVLYTTDSNCFYLFENQGVLNDFWVGKSYWFCFVTDRPRSCTIPL